MIKNIIRLLGVLAFAGWVQLADASLMQYRFEGPITFISDSDGTGLVRELGFEIGDIVHYLIQVDTSQPGRQGINVGGPIVENYLAEYLGGSFSFVAPFPRSFFVNRDPLCSPTNCALAGFGFTDSLNQDGGPSKIFPEGWRLEDLVIGDSGWNSIVTLRDGDRLGGITTSFSLTLTDINTVPLPPALWLFGSALLGLVGIASRKPIRREVLPI